MYLLSIIIDSVGEDIKLKLLILDLLYRVFPNK